MKLQCISGMLVGGQQTVHGMIVFKDNLVYLYYIY